MAAVVTLQVGTEILKSCHYQRGGNTLAVSVPFEDSAATGIIGNQGDNCVDNSGAVYIFTHSDSGWQQQVYLKASNTDLRDAFGSERSINADGNIMAVDCVFRADAVHIFHALVKIGMENLY